MSDAGTIASVTREPGEQGRRLATGTHDLPDRPDLIRTTGALTLAATIPRAVLLNAMHLWLFEGAIGRPEGAAG